MKYDGYYYVLSMDNMVSIEQMKQINPNAKQRRII